MGHICICVPCYRQVYFSRSSCAGWRVILPTAHSHPPLPQEMFLLPGTHWLNLLSTFNCSRIDRVSRRLHSPASFRLKWLEESKASQEVHNSLIRPWEMLPMNWFFLTEGDKIVPVCCLQRGISRVLFCQHLSSPNIRTVDICSLPKAILDALVTEKRPFPGKYNKLYIHCTSSQIKRMIFEGKKEQKSKQTSLNSLLWSGGWTRNLLRSL